MARRIGVRVLTFSLGFGPKLLKVTRGDTEYCISAVPLGGYVKMAGENPDDARTGAPDEFLSKSKWQRFQVLVMGPVMNLALALVVMAAVLYQGAHVPLFEDQPVVVGSVLPGSAGEAAGIQPGDHIISIAGEDLQNWKEFPMVVGTRAGRTVSVVLVRDGNTIETKITPQSRGKFEIGDIGILPVMEPQIAALTESEPAAEAGLHVGDIVLAAAGERKVTYERIVDIIRAHDGQPLPFEIRRNGQVMTITVVPRKHGEFARIGAQFTAFERKPVNPGPLQAIQMSFKQNWEWTTMIVKTLGGLFIGETPVKQLMGPVGYRRDVGQRRFRRMDPAFLVDGNDQPEPWIAEPHARPRARRWTHRHPGARGPFAPRLLHESEGEDAARGFRAAGDADGDRHLQRPDAC